MVRRLLSAFLVLDEAGLSIIEVFAIEQPCGRDEGFRLAEPCATFELLVLEPMGVHPSWAACQSCGVAFLIGGSQP